jgi:hypothetical protein
MKFCDVEFELMLMKLNEPNELEMFRYLDSLHLYV